MRSSERQNKQLALIFLRSQCFCRFEQEHIIQNYKIQINLVEWRMLLIYTTSMFSIFSEHYWEKKRRKLKESYVYPDTDSFFPNNLLLQCLHLVVINPAFLKITFITKKNFYIFFPGCFSIYKTAERDRMRRKNIQSCCRKTQRIGILGIFLGKALSLSFVKQMRCF